MPVDLSFFMTADPPPDDPEPAKSEGNPREVELTEPLFGLPKASKVRVLTEKHLKRVTKEMDLGMRLLDRMSRPALMNPAERREQRRLQQIARRNSKAIGSVVL
jgi:hypothetical protein